ncbi:MAG: hypothetical protein H5U09_03235 [Desulfomicrobiaceae bacterium]|nr:hypothetical protein [Desulfomicrobiaceae bacterium]
MIQDEKTLTIRAQAPVAMAPAFAGLLRQGVGVWLGAPKSVRDFLLEDLGLDVEYATHRVPGLFLNGVAVDDWEAIQVVPGDEVALSGTMPGLAGIALRRQSPLKRFRADLSTAFHARAVAAGTVTVRPFNFVAQDLTQPLLVRGIHVGGDVLASYVQDRSQELTSCRLVESGEPLPQGVQRWRLVERVLLVVEWVS